MDYDEDYDEYVEDMDAIEEAEDVDEFAPEDIEFDMDAPAEPAEERYNGMDPTTWAMQSTSHSVEELLQHQRAEADEIAQLCGLDTDSALLLLRAYKWNRERLLEKYLDSPEATRAHAGVSAEGYERLRREKRRTMCDVCCEDLGAGSETYGLSCGHRACMACYAYMAGEQVRERRAEVVCYGHQCRFIVPDTDVRALVSAEEYAKYEENIVRAIALDRGSLRLCPSAFCANVVDAHPVSKRALAQQEPAPVLECACGTRFCYGCLGAPHVPSTCHIAKLWLRKQANDSETIHWMHGNTKDCPKCQSAIEKNGGCNHMICRSCEYHFCWICLGDWAQHNNYYNCNRLDENRIKEVERTQSRSRALLERYFHYNSRFDNHAQSIRLQDDFFRKTEDKMAAIQESQAMSWIETQFLKRAVGVLASARSVLQWTYAFAFFLERSNHVDVFEDNQSDLESAVERLAGSVEHPFDIKDLRAHRQNITNQSAYVQKRVAVLLHDCLDGYVEGRWVFNEGQ